MDAGDLVSAFGEFCCGDAEASQVDVVDLVDEQFLGGVDFAYGLRLEEYLEGG